MTLAPSDFAGIFKELHGDPPFAWQMRLLDEVLENGWPRAIAAPTGTGKTAVLDIALFHLAVEASSAHRRAPRRIMFAVDRRVIVDQAFDRAKRLRNALAASSGGPLAAMAEALRAVGGDVPLHVEELRGGMPREDDWARSPVQPCILCTTIDQLGSRLLFRGYGVSPSMAPVHAGLLGEDALLFLDEAHLSNAFRETLEGIDRRRNSGLALPWAFCALSATLGDGHGSSFHLNEAERAEPTINRRLSAPKLAELDLCRERASSREHIAAFAAAAETLAQRCTRAVPTIAIIVNRVALARSVLDELRHRQYDAILLTGRVRPVERDTLIREYKRRLVAHFEGDEAEPMPAAEHQRPLFVVTTQCIEVGADFDFDAMVAEIAPLDALRQRFGRLNRRGLREQARAIIVASRDEIARGADDPLYGDRLKQTWEWLTARATPPQANGRPTIQVSPQAFQAFVQADPEGAVSCATLAKSAPVLRAADVAFFATTNPAPYPDPYLPLFLHGEVESAPDVSIVWRADCEIIGSTPAGLSAQEVEKAATEIVACQPPRPGEALRVPIWAAQAWLARPSAEAADFGDAEAELGREERLSGSRRALRWRGPDNDDTQLVFLSRIRPGDLIVVPSRYGGCDRFGWSPAEGAPVGDIANQAAAPYASRYFALRLHPSLWPSEEGCASWEEVWIQLQGDAAERKWAAVRDKLRDIPNLPLAIREELKQLSAAGRLELECPYPTDDEGMPPGAVLIARRGVPAAAKPEWVTAEAATEDDMAGSFGSGPVPLAQHAKAVAEKAESFARDLGLPSILVNTVAFSAEHHDDGKLDPRFQAWLAGPGMPSTEPLAKSGRWRGTAVEAAARTAAGLPPAWRHEALSVRIAAALLAETAEEIDRDLAIYLIGSHHGHGHPFFSHHDAWDAHGRTLGGVTIDPGAGPERLDFDWRGRDWAELFNGLQRRYGPWGLAFLEAVLRLADHRASEEPG